MSEPVPPTSPVVTSIIEEKKEDVKEEGEDSKTEEGTMVISPIEAEEGKIESIEMDVVEAKEEEKEEEEEEEAKEVEKGEEEIHPIQEEGKKPEEKKPKEWRIHRFNEAEVKLLTQPYIEFNNSNKRFRESDFIYRPKLNNYKKNDVPPLEDGKEKEEEEEEEEEPHSKKRLIYSTALPSKPDYNIRWIERVASYYVPSASFTYEVQYSNPKHYPLGFTIQWQHIPYSPSAPAKTILVCVVKTVAENFHPAIAMGDIILKLNDEPLVYKPGDTVDEKRILHIFTSEGFNNLNSFTSLRFLRAGSTCNGCIPSVAEILLLLNEKNAGAKYNVKVNTKDNQEFFGLELIQMDNQLPNSVKKLLQAQKISWQQIPILSIGSAQANYLISANITPPLNSIATSIIGPMTLNYTAPLYSIHSPQLEEIMQPGSDSFIKSGIYRDKSKFVVIYVDQHTDPNYEYTHSLEPIPAIAKEPKYPKIYNLGRFENEEEAKKVYQKVLQSAEITGNFNLKYYLLGYQKGNTKIITEKKE